MMHKKAVFDKVVIILGSLVFMGLLLVLSIKFITMIQKSGQDAQIADFSHKLQEDVNKIRSMDNVRIVAFQLPLDTKQVCILDDRASKEELEDYVYMKEAIGTDNNIFVYKDNVPDMLSISHLGVMVYPFFACEPVDHGKLTLELTGRTNNAYVYPRPDPDFCRIAEESTPNTCELLNIIYEEYSTKCCQLYGKCC